MTTAPAADATLLTLAAASGNTHTMLLTMVAAISAGVMLIVVARRLGVPAIVLLLVGGAALGPSVWGDWAPVQPESLGDGLLVVVSLAVGLILFEGGLTLDVSGYRSASTVIKRLLTIGVLVTWWGTAAAVHLIYDLPVSYAVVAGSLVIVTGPTVIAPLLKRIKVNAKMNSILHWEGVLIDPIGVFIAVLCFEWISDPGGSTAIANLGLRIAAGLGFGAIGGLLISFFVRRNIVPEEMVNVFALACAVLTFGLAEAVRSEAGLLSVTTAGFIVGLTRSVTVKQIRAFKAELTDLLIGTLFILLAARLSPEQFADFGWRGVAAVAVVIFLVRPISVALCSWRLDLTMRERAFLGWVAPRGIVAASMASLFAINLEGTADIANPKFVETFTYSVIIGTIVLQGATAGPLAQLLGLKRPKPTGWFIVGAHAFARRIASFLRDAADVQVILADTNARAVRESVNEGLRAITVDARDKQLADREEFQGIGNVLAMTDNEDLNVRICQNWREIVGSAHVFRCNTTGAAPSAEEEAEATAGKLIWPKLPKPSLLAGELLRREASLLETTGGPGFAQFAMPVATVSNSRIQLDPDPEQIDQADEQRRTLYLQREADYLLRSLRPELVVTIESTDLRQLLESLVDLIVTVSPKLPRDDTIEELMEREATFPTALGGGVAVPHAFSNALDERICAIARLTDGLEFGAMDGEPVRLVFLLLSPQGDPEGHLATLAEIARLVIDTRVRDRIMTAESPLELIRIVRELERR
jgi:NhaP-type Na+/H+ or K+/H+ antiporter/mannitol/fructose-specific phosphotransferase system IIA component (Ntr-type)